MGAMTEKHREKNYTESCKKEKGLKDMDNSVVISGEKGDK